MKKRIISALIILIITIVVGYASWKCGNVKVMPLEEDLIKSIPEIDISAFNKFKFRMDASVKGEKETDSISMSGYIEVQDSISHMYDLNITNKGEHITSESWTDVDASKRYITMDNKFSTDSIVNRNIISNLEKAINNRNSNRCSNITDTVCTVSWEIPIDNDYIFGNLVKLYTEDPKLVQTGRLTAVFTPDTYEFQYFTVTILASNKSNTIGYLNAIFYWNIMNDDFEGLKISA